MLAEERCRGSFCLLRVASWMCVLYTLRMRELHVRRLGLVEYEDGPSAQRLLVEARAAGLVPDTLLLLEHPRFVTIGLGAKPHNVRWTPDQLRARGFDLFETDRRGDVTYHGTGQL